MDAADWLKQDVLSGKITLDRVVELIVSLQEENHELRTENADLKSENEELRKIGQHPTPRLDEAYSTRSEEKRKEKTKKKRRRKQKSKRRGRFTTEEKIAQAKRGESVYPDGAPPELCKFSHTRPVWRIEDGQAVLVAYHIYRAPNGDYGKIEGVLGRSEYGMEIMLSLGYLLFVERISFDGACRTLQFFQNLKLSKSQADTLLHQLARHWNKEFDALCVLLANSAIVHADETSWSIKSVWAFLSENARIFCFGVPKSGETLKQILDLEKFLGMLISDNAAVYGRFTKMQKCWAHLLRKAIKLTVQDPENKEYRTFADELIEIYRRACQSKSDGRLNEAGRAARVLELEEKLRRLCAPMWLKKLPKSTGVADEYRRLVNELMRLLLARALFTFVTTPDAEQPNGETHAAAGTNNLNERELRGTAQDRATGRTSKTLRGARRQTIVKSVLESLRLYLQDFTLATVLTEVARWCEVGISCFAKLLRKHKLKMPGSSILDDLIPDSSG